MAVDLDIGTTSARVSRVAAPVPASRSDHPVADGRLAAFLDAWLGLWPPASALQVIAWPDRDVPGWDGKTWAGLGVESPAGTVVSLSARLFAGPETIDDAAIAIAAALSIPTPAQGRAALGASVFSLGRAVFRWSERPAALPDIGEWRANDDPRVPDWLRVFNGDVLVAWDDDGRVAAGVGRKIHNRHGQELAVVTEPGNEGRGLARHLIAQAARRVLADGAIPLYFHAPDQIASARVAKAAGFPDRGWQVISMQHRAT